MDPETWDQATPGEALDSCFCPIPPTLFSQSSRCINPRVRTASVSRRAETSQIYLSRLSLLSAHIPCQNNKQVTANLLSAALFKKTVYTPLTR